METWVYMSIALSLCAQMVYIRRELQGKIYCRWLEVQKCDDDANWPVLRCSKMLERRKKKGEITAKNY